MNICQKRMGKQIILTILILMACCKIHGQFSVDTLFAIEINGKKLARKPILSTFTKKLSTNKSVFACTYVGSDTNQKESMYPLMLEVKNDKNYKVRIDSIWIRTSPFNTSKIEFVVNIFSANRLYSSNHVHVTNIDNKLNSIKFDEDTYLPQTTSYLGFSFKSKTDFQTLKKELDEFVFYTNKSIDGFVCSYNRNTNEFKRISFDDWPQIGSPQVQIYISRVE